MALKKRSSPELEIIKLLSQGDSSCLSLVYKYFGPSLYGIILRIVKTDQVAEEVLQDVFLKFWNNANSYDPEKSRLFTWLANIARNSAIDKIRSAQYKKGSKIDSLDNYVSFKTSVFADSEIEDHGLKAVIDGLDEKYKKLIYLVYFEGYSQREIAKEFDIPLGTVKTRIRDAIKILRTKLNNEIIDKLLYLIPLGFHLLQIINY